MTDAFDPPRPWTRSYAPGVPDDLPEMTGSLMDLVADSAREFPDAPALEFFGRVTRYGELAEAIERAAAGLRAQGVRKGDTVALVLPNCSQHIIAFYAVLRLGAIVVEHNPLYTARELRKQFEDHGAKHAIVWSKVASTIQDFPADLAVSTLVSVDVTQGMPRYMRAALRLPIPKLRAQRAQLTERVRGAISWEQVVGYAPLSPAVPGPDTDDIAVIQYTSGTTGDPKGASLTHRNLLANAAQARAWIPEVHRGEGTVVYAVLPMFHAYGLTLCLTFAMSQAARLVLFPKFDPDMVLKVTKRYPATVLPAVPPIASRLLQRAKEKGVSLEGTRIGVSGAMALDADALVEPWERETKGYLVEGYGLSECSPVLIVNPVSDDRKAGSIGLPLPGTEARVVDPDDPTRDVPQGEAGELVVRGPQVFGGYYGRPEETERVFVDGWFRTGDIVEMDEDGFFRVVDRIKELIITGGFNVAPTEVEIALRQHPSIADAAVVGLPGANGEEVVAAVVLDGATEIDAGEVRDFVKRILTPYKAPRRVVVVDALPTSMIGKVLRREVREQLLAADAR